MKDKNGIEIKCENCKDCENHLILCADRVDNSIKCFNPTTNALEARITELQAQQFTREEIILIEQMFIFYGQPEKEHDFRKEYDSVRAKCDAILKGDKLNEI